MRIRVAVCLKDIQYSNKISSYFTTHYGESVEVYSFSGLELLQKYLDTHVMDVLLADDSFDERSVSEWPDMLIMKLVQNIDSSKKDDGVIFIGKYQKASLIYREILHYCSRKKEFNVKKGSNRTIFISFSSITGGAGATTIATAFALYLARQGRKVLFLNMEEFGDTSILLGKGGNYGFEEILLALKTTNRNLAMKLQSAVSKTEEEVYFYSSCENPVDFSQLTADETREFLSAVSSLDYQYVVMDFKIDLSERCRELMNKADKMVLVADGTKKSKLGLERIARALGATDGIDRTRNSDKLVIFNNKVEKGKAIDISNNDIPNIGAVAFIDGMDPKEITWNIAGRIECFNELA